MAGNGQHIIELDKQRMQAMASKDVAMLNKLLADDLIYCHSSARLDTKQSLIGAMQSGATVYTGVEPSEVKAQDCGDAVVLQRRPSGRARRHRRGAGRLADGDLAVHAPA